MEEIDFFKLFHQSSKSLTKGHPPIPRNSREWPAEWKTVYCNEYPRFPKVTLPDTKFKADLFNSIERRESQRDFSKGNISLEELSMLLKYSCGEVVNIKNKHHRAQPSGGGRYPIEVYPIIFRDGEGVKSGLYHYNVKKHELDILWYREFGENDIDKLFTYGWAKDASLAIVMTAVFWRNQNKYGERGYRHILQETGHIGQNLYLVSGALGLKCCAIAGTIDQNIDALLDVDGETESVVYSLVIGK